MAGFWQRLKRFFLLEDEPPPTHRPEPQPIDPELLQRAERIMDSLPVVPTWYQREDALRALRVPGFLFCYQRGVGKTLPALICAKALGNRTLVITPVSAISNWYREAARVGLHIDTESWAAIPDYVDRPFTLIVDEFAHGKNWYDTDSGAEYGSQRAKRLVHLAANAAWFTGLSGSPLPNGRGKELYPILRCARHPIANNWNLYRMRFCMGKRMGYNKMRALSNATLLRREIADIVAFRSKKDCLNLPPLSRVMVPVTPSPEALMSYNATYSRLKAEHDRRVAMGIITKKMDALVILGYLRHAAEMAKVDASVRLALSFIRNMRKVILYTNFRDVARMLHQQLPNSELILGNTKYDERQNIVNRLTYDGTEFIVSTYGSAGEALNIQAATAVILVGRTWVPSDADQAEGRIDRMGQQFSTFSCWMQFGHIDNRVDHRLIDKQKAIDSLWQGVDLPWYWFDDSITDIAPELIREIFEHTSEAH